MNIKSKSKIIIISSVSIAVIALSLLIVAIFLTNSSDNSQSNVVLQCDKDFKVFSSNNAEEINRLIYHNNIYDQKFYDSIKKFITSPSDEASSQGIMFNLMSLSNIEYISHSDTNVTLHISAPDMSSFGAAILDKVTDQTTEDDLKNMILDYASQAKRLERDVTLNYTVNEGHVIINYNTTDFLYTVTGDLHKGYAEVYQKYLDELASEVK